MKRQIKASVIALSSLLLSMPPRSAGRQPKHLSVTLHVKYNGKRISPPERVTLIFHRRSVNLSLRGSRFDVPSGIFETKGIAMVTRIGDEEIKISGIYGNQFRQDDWTLILADREYDTDNQWVVPKGASVQSSCILTFQSDTAEGTALFEPHCRYPLRSP